MLNRAEFQRKALELFQQRGFSAVSMRELAAHVGISPGSIYHHIDNKETLLYDALAQLYQALDDSIEAVRKRRLGAHRALSGVIDSHLRLHESMPGHFKLATMDHGQLSAPLHADIAALRQRYEAQMLGLMRGVCAVPGGPLREAGFRTLLPLLSSLPGWLSPHLPAGQRRTLARTLIMGMLAEVQALP